MRTPLVKTVRLSWSMIIHRLPFRSCHSSSFLLVYRTVVLSEKDLYGEGHHLVTGCFYTESMSDETAPSVTV
jgi:hypothetical protein